jgi:hypothetical protein
MRAVKETVDKAGTETTDMSTGTETTEMSIKDKEAGGA